MRSDAVDGRGNQKAAIGPLMRCAISRREHCHMQHAMNALLDYLVSARKQRWRNLQAKRLGGFD
jgi:hypothetical protein